MPKITFLPQKKICPKGAIIKTKLGESILNVAIKNGIKIEHACQKSCACATCHCIIRKGFFSLNKISELEEDMLDKAWGLEPTSRLSCQAKIGNADLIIEIPYYTINYINNN
ncbi:2Fe-2S ferredoxin [Serratia symbiotica]|nr:2Fe-2S ferredoxin [Serratia symbiotica]